MEKSCPTHQCPLEAKASVKNPSKLYWKCPNAFQNDCGWHGWADSFFPPPQKPQSKYRPSPYPEPPPPLIPNGGTVSLTRVTPPPQPMAPEQQNFNKLVQGLNDLRDMVEVHIMETQKDRDGLYQRLNEIQDKLNQLTQAG